MDLEQIKTAVYANLIIVVGLCILFGIVTLNTLFDQRQRKLFLYAIAGNLFVIICVIIDSFCARADAPIAVIIRRFTSFINFSASPIIPILLASVFSNRRRHIIYYFPAAINFLTCLISTSFPLVFEISYQNTYRRGILFLLPITTALLYTALLLIEPSAKHRRAQRQQRIFLILVIILLAGSMALEIYLKMSFQLWSMAGLSLILYYLLLNVHYFTLDSLTGCYNRMAFQWTISVINGKRSCIVTAMDLNGLKLVNDTVGHAEGDRLLLRFATLLSQLTASSSDLYRIGGDEFVLITTLKKVEKYHIGMEKMLVAAEKEGISFALGEAVYMPAHKIENIIALADERMYEMKKKMKPKL